MHNFAQVKAEFEANGCAVIPNFLSRQQLVDLESHTAEFLANNPTLTNDTRRSKHGSKFDGTIKNMNVSDSWFDNELRCGRPSQLITYLLEDRLEPATAAYFNRIPGETTGIRPHFDAIGHRRFGATLWIALDRSDTGNGCLYYAAGSHRRPQQNKLDLKGFDDKTLGAFPVELNPGDAAVHSSLTVHWSYANASQRSRRAVSYFYWAASSKPEIQSELKK